MSAVPTVVIDHLAGNASLGEMLVAQTPHGARACAFELSEVPALINVLRSDAEKATPAGRVRFHHVADTLGILVESVPGDLIERRCLVIPVCDADRANIRLAVVSKWQRDIEIAALLVRDHQGVNVKRPGSPDLDQLQARVSEYPIHA